MLKTIITELADMLGQIIRQDHGRDTWRNVWNQARAYFG